MGSKVRRGFRRGASKKAPRFGSYGHGKTVDLIYKSFSSKRKFGVEIEMSNGVARVAIKRAIEETIKEDVRCCRYVLSASNTCWHVKSDMSCGVDGSDGPSGLEVSTRICSGRRDISIVSKAAKAVVKCGASVNEHCGLHVHVDVSDFDENDVGRLILYWMVVEKILMLALPERRWDNKYCKMLDPNEMFEKNPYNNFMQNTFIKKYSKIPRSWFEVARIFRPFDGLFSINTAKRRTMNINNFYKALEANTNHRKTIEFRWPEGTLCSNDIKSWIVLFVNFVDFVKSRNYFPLRFSNQKYTVSLCDVLEMLGIGHCRKNFFIFDKTLNDTRKWLLNRIIDNPDDAFFSSQKEIKKQARTLLNKIQQSKGV